MNTEIDHENLKIAEAENLKIAALSGNMDNPSAVEFLKKIFTVEYRADGAIHHRNFISEAGLPGAIERAKSYCARMRYRFIFCSAFLTNLEENEKKMERFG